MNNPYEVLGLKDGATENEIKAAYRELVKKYHPDKHQDNTLRDLAEEKMREINEAYDALINNNGGGYTSSSFRGSGNGAPEFREIRRDIDRGDLAGAERKLQASRKKNAEWYFLFGMLNLRRGWYNEGINSIQTAVSLEPTNAEYRNALNQVMNQTNGYNTSAQGRGYAGTSTNDAFCQALQCYCCADLCCDCI